MHGVKFDVKHGNVLAKAMVAQIPERQPKIVFPPRSRNGEAGVADAGLEYSLRRRHA